MKNASELDDTRSALLRAGVAVTVLVASGLVQAATITVDTNSDEIDGNDDCSLREALINANNNNTSGSDACAAGEAGPDTVDEIVFAPATDGTPVTLSIAGVGENAAMTGDLDITDDVRITGNGDVDPALDGGTPGAATVVDGDGIDRVFHVAASGIAATLEGFEIRGGSPPQYGAGLAAEADSRVTLRDMLVSRNSVESGTGGAPIAGGGLYKFAGGELILERTAVVANILDATDSSATGGGIAGDGSITLTDSVIAHNTIDNGSDIARGAGIDFGLDSGDTLTADNLIVASNVATSTDTAASGAGIVLQGSGSAEIDHAGIHGNSAVALNSANAIGGGIVTEAHLTLRNVTISGNSAQADSGGAWGGGLVSQSPPDVVLDNVTVTNNTAEATTAANGFRGGIDLLNAGSTAISNSIVAGNSDSSGTHPDCHGTIDSTGYNLVGDDTGCDFVVATGDLVGSGGSLLDPMLEPLDDNGGGFSVGIASVAQRTHALAEGSPAIDAGNPNPVMAGAAMVCEPVDQRGGVRPADGDDDGAAVCDMGAFELGADITDGAGSGGGGGGPVGPLALALMGWLALVRGAVTCRRPGRGRME